MNKFSARIDKKAKVLRITDRSVFDEWVRTESEKETDYLYEIKISKVSKAHSREQENFRWGVMYPEILFMMRDAGWENVRNKEDVHEIVCSLFLKEDIYNEKTGEVMQKPLRSSGLNKEDENEFQESIRYWAREYFNTELSLPNEQKSIL
jgi:hypothetical protein